MDIYRYTPVGLMTRCSMLEYIFRQASAKFSDIGGGINVNMVHSDGAKEYITWKNDMGGG